MLKKALHFIKYNNAALLIFAAIFFFGAGVFAQTEAGQEFIGEKQVRLEGLDNTLLLDADLENFGMDFKIERIEEDETHYYVTYTYLDLAKNNSAWEYRIFENTRKITVARVSDLGEYIAEEMGQQYDARIKELKTEQEKALAVGQEVRREVEEYSGLIGQSLDAISRVWPGYTPVKVYEVPSPDPSALFSLKDPAKAEMETGKADNLTQIYLDYIAQNDPFGELTDSDAIDDDPVAVVEEEETDGTEEIISEETDGTEEIISEEATGTEVVAEEKTGEEDIIIDGGTDAGAGEDNGSNDSAEAPNEVKEVEIVEL